jgi:hypothetical protein
MRRSMPSREPSPAENFDMRDVIILPGWIEGRQWQCSGTIGTGVSYVRGLEFYIERTTQHGFSWSAF